MRTISDPDALWLNRYTVPLPAGESFALYASVANVKLSVRLLCRAGVKAALTPIPATQLADAAADGDTPALLRFDIVLADGCALSLYTLNRPADQRGMAQLLALAELTAISTPVTLDELA